MPHRVDVFEMDGRDPITQAIAMVVWMAWKGGVRSPGEKMTVVVPPMDMGDDETKMVDVGEYEIEVRKV
jgi:hypothetical protein